MRATFFIVLYLITRVLCDVSSSSVQSSETQSATASPTFLFPDPLPSPICNNSTSKHHYVNRDTLHHIIEQRFCPAAIRPSSSKGNTTRVYNQETPEEVRISIDRTKNPDFRVNEDQCLEIFSSILQCNNGFDNATGWEGGGELHMDRVTFAIKPRAIRPSAPNKPWGRCLVHHKGATRHFNMWGGGWQNLGDGTVLKQKIDDTCGLAFNLLGFDYVLGKDGREWDAIGIALQGEECLTKAAKLAGAPTGFKCVRT